MEALTNTATENN